MKKISIVFVVLLLSNSARTQNGTMYAAAKAGLSIRETADPKGKVLDKIPYGEKITTAITDTVIAISTEGFNGSWVKTTYKGKSGYIVNSYLFNVPPPKATVKTLKDYFGQLSSTAGPAVTIGDIKTAALENDAYSTTKKQLYKNGMEIHEFVGYEYNSETYFLPGFSIEQGFLLVRMLKLYPDAIPESEPFPKKSGKKTIKTGERITTVERETWGDPGNQPIKKIRFEWGDGASYFLEIYQMEDQLIIYTGSGV